MTLTVGQNSHVSVTDADTYFRNRDNTTWLDTDVAAKEAALVEGTQYLDGSYRWKGTVAAASQSLSWPRADVVDREGRDLSSATVPEAIKDATCELALAQIGGPLLPPLARGGRSTKEKVGPIEVSYAPGAAGGTSYALVDRLVAGLHTGQVSGAMVEIVRS